MIKVTFKISLTVGSMQSGSEWERKQLYIEHNLICSDRYSVYNSGQSRMVNFGINGERLNGKSKTGFVSKVMSSSKWKLAI